MLSPADVITRLEAIEADLADRMNPWETAAEESSRTKRQWELAMAQVRGTIEGASVAERDAAALTTLVAQQPDLYERLVESEATVNAIQKAVNLLTERGSYLQSILRAHTREQFQGATPEREVIGRRAA